MSKYLIHFNHNHDKLGRFSSSGLPSVSYTSSPSRGQKARRDNKRDKKEIELATQEMNSANSEYSKLESEYLFKQNKAYKRGREVKPKEREYYERMMNYDLERIRHAQTRIENAKKRINMRYGREPVWVITYPTK